MRPAKLLVLPCVLLTLVVGCAKKAPKTTPLPPASAMQSEEAALVPAAAPAPATATPEHDPLAADLESVNRYVREQGLLEDVYYDYDQSGLRDDTRRRLQQNAEFLRRNPQFVVTVEGHSDERGTIAYNLALGQRRASAARDYLQSLDISDQQLRTLSLGEERPACVEPFEDCWWRNRRARFVITERR